MAALSARQATLHERQVDLASLLSEFDAATRIHLTHRSVEQRIVETARLVAEVLELAEAAAQANGRARGGRRALGMRALADACFDAILRLDAARQELIGSLGADQLLDRRQRREALRCARDTLTELEQELARTLAN